jgi:hypothetical protein
VVSDTFYGQLIGQVQCLECETFSDSTTEQFQLLSLPIPSKESIDSLQQQQQQQKHQQSNQQSSWLTWAFGSFKSLIWSPTIRLDDCLNAFFSDDDLKGENKYSCDKCKRLTNGVKYSKVLHLPEILIVHLKRFKHDSMFSTGKISTFISFPDYNLDMRPYLHKDCRNEVSTYDLSGIICHYGGANGGHYIAYTRNPQNNEWYEYDDSFCRKVDNLTIQNSNAYVLFYRKQTLVMEDFKVKLRQLIATRCQLNNSSSLMMSSLNQKQFYISKQWIHKLKYFAEPGFINNDDWICSHGLVQPDLWYCVDSLVFSVSPLVWNMFMKTGFASFNKSSCESIVLSCSSSEMSVDDESSLSSSSSSSSSLIKKINYSDRYKIETKSASQLTPCHICQLDDEAMWQRQLWEKNQFIKLRDKWHSKTNSNPNFNRINSTDDNITFAINSVWFKQWETFVQSKRKQFPYDVPPPINNLPICIKSQENDKKTTNEKVFYLNKSNFYQFF